MHCYCYSQFLKIGLKVANIQFEQDDVEYCDDWL
jgi:hypothetical protein